MPSGTLYTSIQDGIVNRARTFKAFNPPPFPRTRGGHAATTSNSRRRRTIHVLPEFAYFSHDDDRHADARACITAQKKEQTVPEIPRKVLGAHENTRARLARLVHIRGTNSLCGRGVCACVWLACSRELCPSASVCVHVCMYVVAVYTHRTQT